jgi:hypothetical protein
MIVRIPKPLYFPHFLSMPKLRYKRWSKTHWSPQPTFMFSPYFQKFKTCTSTSTHICNVGSKWQIIKRQDEFSMCKILMAFLTTMGTIPSKRWVSHSLTSAFQDPWPFVQVFVTWFHKDRCMRVTHCTSAKPIPDGFFQPLPFIKG